MDPKVARLPVKQIRKFLSELSVARPKPTDMVSDTLNHFLMLHDKMLELSLGLCVIIEELQKQFPEEKEEKLIPDIKFDDKWYVRPPDPPLPQPPREQGQQVLVEFTTNIVDDGKCRQCGGDDCNCSEVDDGGILIPEQYVPELMEKLGYCSVCGELADHVPNGIRCRGK